MPRFPPITAKEMALMAPDLFRVGTMQHVSGHFAVTSPACTQPLTRSPL